MRTDLMIRLDTDGAVAIPRPFTINVLYFADDGYLYAIRSKTFDLEFKAKDLKHHTRDAHQWSEVTKEQFQELKKSYYGMA